MKITYQNGDNIQLDKIAGGILEMLKRNKIDFKTVETTGTRRFYFKNEVVEIVPDNKDLAGHGANFIRDVKKHFSGMHVPKRINEDRPYYDYFVPISTYTELENVVEIDINSAYWEAAEKLGYLSSELYGKADSAKVPKKARLIALGVLGKRTVTKEYRYPYDEIETKEFYADTRPFWDNIVFTLGEVMREVVTRYKAHVYGVWFDAMFCDRGVANNIRRFMQRRGYEVKIIPLRSYIVAPRSGIVPGAKVTRIFQDGSSKEMDVSYLVRNKTFDNFIEMIR